jgi:hypothetical protein
VTRNHDSVNQRQDGIAMDRETSSRYVTASEAGTYAFCAKSWHLEYVLDASPSQAARQLRVRGTTAHEAHGAQVRKSPRVTQLMTGVTIVLFATSVVLFALSIAVAVR